MKGWKRTLAFLLSFVLLCGLLPVSAHAAATNVSGTIYASNLASKADVVLTGNTTLVMDVEKELRTITGNYKLTVEGSKTLTLKRAGKVINVADLVISAPLIVTGGNDKAIYANSGSVVIYNDVTVDAVTGIWAKNNVAINSGYVVITAGIKAIVAEKGAITIKDSVVASSNDSDVLNADQDILIDLPAGCFVIANASTGEDAIFSRNGNITIEGGAVNAEGYHAIYAKNGDISLSSTITAKGGNEAAIKAPNGTITINFGSVDVEAVTGIWAKNDINISCQKMNIKAQIGGIVSTDGSISISGDVTATSKAQTYGGIWASGDLTIHSGTIDVTDTKSGSCLFSKTGNIVVEDGTITAAGAYGINAKQGYISLAGNVNAASGAHPAIYAQNSSITLNGAIVANSNITGIWAKNDITINGGSVISIGKNYGIIVDRNFYMRGGAAVLTGSKYALLCENNGNIAISSPLSIIVPSNGSISGKTIVNGYGRTATYAEIRVPPLTGSISNSGLTPAPGTQLSYSLSGMVAGIPESKLCFQWQESSDGSAGWTNKVGATAKYYVVQTADVGKYVRVKITADGYDGMLYSSPWLCCKWPCETGVVSPILEISNNQVRVTNPQKNQEYIILTTKKQGSSLTESDWASSKTWSSGIFYLGGTTNTVNYVYTRVKEDSWHYAGKTVGWQSIYLGATTSVQDIAIRPELMVASGSSWTTQELETDEHGFYYTKLQDVIKITAVPTPANATFNGILGSKWLVKGYSRTSQYGKYYTTPECTTVISADQSYKVVYFRPENTMINGMELRAEYTRGYNDVVTDAFSINVGNKLGVYNLDSVQFPTVTINVGDTLTGLTAEPHPDKAALSGMSATLSSGTGAAPVISFAEASFSVDAANATGGTYYFNVSKSGSQVGGITVKVIAPPVEELRLVPSELTGEAGFSYELAPQFSPANSETQATWTSSNTAAATVADGVVTIPANADIGATATITATAGGKSATCLVTVAGELYDLKLDGVQVSSRNMDDVLGNGVFAFDGFQTLTVRGSYSSSRQVIDNDIDGLIIEVESDSTLTSTGWEAISTSADATITGSGKLTLTSKTDCGVYLTGKKATLTILDATLAVNGKWGLAGPNSASSAKLVIDHSSVTAKATSGAICDFGGGITIRNSEIVKPAGGKISGDGKNLVDASGTIFNNVQIDAQLILPTVRFTIDSEPVVGGRLTVDIDKMAEWDETLMEAYLSDGVRYQWYRDGKPIAGADKETLKLTYTEKDTEVYVVVSYGAYRIESEHLNVLFLSNPFTDVTEGKYFFNPVMWAYYHDPQITAGTSKTTFSPNDTCTRAQIVTFLWRAAGSPEPKTAKNPFQDVRQKDYFYKAVLWAVENGITSGTGKTKFSPNDACTRAQVVTFLWRCEKQVKPKSSVNPFKDVKSNAYYYKAVLWAVENGVTSGTSKTKFSPDATCTRGQIVTFLYRDIAKK